MADLGAVVAAGEQLVAHSAAAPCRDVALEESEILSPAEARSHPAELALWALSPVAHDLARVPPAGEHLSAGLVAVPLASPADDLLRALPAGAAPLHLNFAGGTFSLVAELFAPVHAAGQQPPTGPPARELLVRTAAALGRLPAETLGVHLVRARRARPRVAQQQARVPARRLKGLPADLAAGVRRPPQVDGGVDHLPAEAPSLCGALVDGVHLAALGAFPRGDDVREDLLGEDLGPRGRGLGPPLDADEMHDQIALRTLPDLVVDPDGTHAGNAVQRLPDNGVGNLLGTAYFPAGV